MNEAIVIVERAIENDLDGIVALQDANQIARGGSLSARLPRDRILAMMRSMPLIVARREGTVVGFLMTTAKAMNADIAIVNAMFTAYPGTSDAYVYGPICVGSGERGMGLAQALFKALQKCVGAREGVLFIRRDNLASLRAHGRMGMREVAAFTYQDAEYAVFSTNA